MENADTPAMPIGNADETLDNTYQNARGLTKREEFAKAAMTGLIALKGSDCLDSEVTANQCVRMADALLEALES